MPARNLAVVNPASRHGATARHWDAVEARLRDALGGDLEVERTRGPRDAARIAREGVRAGAERVLVVGGDGTTSEVVSGLLAADLGRHAEIGLLPFGTGGDLARTLGIPRDPDAAIAAFVAGKSRRIDAGRVHYRNRAGDEVTSYFLNVASIGASAAVTERVNRSSGRLGGTAAFLMGSLATIVHWRSPDVTLRLDGVLVHEGPLALATAANGRFFGGGMQVSPEALPDDGLLDVVVIPDVGKARMVALLARSYRGTHLAHPAVSLHRGRTLEADAEPGRVWLEIDGEPLGTLPARFELLPGAVGVIGAG